MSHEKTLNNDLFETMLKGALLEKYANEVDSLRTGPGDKPFSTAFDKKAARIFRRGNKPKLLKNIGRFAAKVLASILMISGIAFVLLLTQPMVYAAVTEVIRTIFADHDSYSGIGDSDMNGIVFHNDILPSHIPEGFVLRQVFYGDYNVDFIYEDAYGNSIYYGYSVKEVTQISANNERVTFSEKQKNGITYYIYESTAPEDLNTVIWYNDIYGFMLKSQLPVNEIVKIAESVLEVQ